MTKTQVKFGIFKLEWLIFDQPSSMHGIGTGKSLSEALIFASINPQYDNQLFMELPVQYMKTTSAEHGQNTDRNFLVRFDI